MTPSQQAKALGIKSMKQVSQMTEVSTQTLINWHRDKPELYRVVLLGCTVDLKLTDDYLAKKLIEALEGR